MEKLLKGEGLHNRYRITGKLRTISPLHIGTGEEDPERIPKIQRSKKKKDSEIAVRTSTVMKDARGKPVIPGSALKGVMRHWLLNVLAGVSPEWANTHDDEIETMNDLTQEEQIVKLKNYSWLELLFGTPFHEGKLEAWDALCLTSEVPATDSLLNWSKRSLTYVDTSVAIDPATGTAKENLLYKAEVVPPGVEFELNLTGQNLSEDELGLVLFALQGFNSSLYPIRVGARGGRGFGRLQFIPGPIYALQTAAEIRQWIAATMRSYGTGATKPEQAGYFALPILSEQAQTSLIANVKNKFLTALEARP